MKKFWSLVIAVLLTGCTGVDVNDPGGGDRAQQISAGSAYPTPPSSPPPGGGGGSDVPPSSPPPGDGGGSDAPPMDGGPPGGGDGSDAPPSGTCSGDESCDGDETCNSGGTCEECSSITVPALVDGEAPPPPTAPMGAGAVSAKGGVTILQEERLAAEVLRDGTIVLRNRAGQVVETLRGVLVWENGAWRIPQTFRNPVPQILSRVGSWTFRCVSGIGLMLLGAEMANAGMSVALGPLAAQIGVRQKDCQDRFAAAAGGIHCLLSQPSNKSCTDAVSACPDAFFGANLVQSCGTEPGMADLVAALARAIGLTSIRAGGFGTISPDVGNLIGQAIQSGQFATNPQMTCTMRPSTRGCSMTDGSVFTVPGFAAAKACWDGSSWPGRYAEAQRCCAGNAACLAQLVPMKDC